MLTAFNALGTCQTKITYQTVESNETSIYKASSIANLPSSAIYPVNVTIDVSQYVIGPTLDVSGIFAPLRENDHNIKDANSVVV